MAFEDSVTCVWGRRGSGKTTLAKRLISQHRPPQVVVIDPLAKDGVNLPGLVDAIERGQRGITVKVDGQQNLGAVLICYLMSHPARPIFALCDEAPEYLGGISDAIKKVMYQGRHAAFGMCIVGQRPAAVHAGIRSQAERTYWMALSDHVDTQTAAHALGTERARTLPGFDPGEFILWPEQGGVSHGPASPIQSNQSEPSGGRAPALAVDGRQGPADFPHPV